VAVGGNYSETWTLENGDKKTNTLCIDNGLSSENILVIARVSITSFHLVSHLAMSYLELLFQINDNNQASINTSKPEIKLNFLFTLNQAVLNISGIDSQFNVTNEMPHTFVVMSARPDSSHREHFVLKFKSRDKKPSNLCAVVTVQVSFILGQG
jgi:hypothetical protein